MNENPKEPELTDEEIDRIIKELERKKKRKEKDFEMYKNKLTAIAPKINNKCGIFKQFMCSETA